MLTRNCWLSTNLGINQMLSAKERGETTKEGDMRCMAMKSVEISVDEKRKLRESFAIDNIK
jgi:hypothetical protein